MTSKVSNKKISPVLHNFECGVKTKIKMAIIIGILHLAAAPAVIISLIAGIYSKEPTSMVESFAVIGVITTAIAGFMGIFIAIDSFSCLHNKSVVDMRLSLPLTSAQRFFSNFLSGFAVYIVPFLAAQVVSLLGMAYGFIFMEGRTFEEYRYDSWQDPWYKEYTCEFFSTALPMLLKLIVAGILVMLMLYTVTVLVTVCCGNKFESIAYTILINIMIPLTIYLVFMSMFSDLYGIDMSDVIMGIIMFTSPAGGILAAVGMAIGNSSLMNNFSMNYLVWGICYFLITAGIGAGAFFLYKKRRAEQVSKPFVFKLLYYIISTAVIFCIYSVFYYDDIGIVPAILTTVIVYVILEVAANRGFKKIWLSLIKYAGVMAVSVLIIFAAQKTEGFGMVTRVPDISQVKYVELDYGGFYGMFHLPREYDESGWHSDYLEFDNSENIETIISAHKNVISDENRIERSARPGNGFEVRYHLKSGGTMVRRYSNTPAETAEMLGKLDLTDEYRTQLAEKYKKKIFDAKKEYLDMYEYNPKFASSLKFYLSDESQDYFSEVDAILVTKLIDKDFFEQLAEAYAKDIINITEENYYRSSAKNIYSLEIRMAMSFEIDVPESFGNTLELLEYFGFNIFKRENLTDMELNEYFESTIENRTVKMYTAEEWREMNDVPAGIPLHGKYCSTSGKDNVVIKADKDFCDLVRAAEPMNIVPDNGYIIYVFGRTWAIPEELNGTAERVYAGISKNARVEYDEYGNPFWLESTDEKTLQEVPVYTETAIYD